MPRNLVLVFTRESKNERSKRELRAGKHEAVVLSVGLCKFTNLHGDLYLQYSVTQKKLYIKSKTPCPIRFLTTGQYLFVVVHVFSLFVHVLVIFDSWGAKDSESPPTEDVFDLHRIFSRPGHNFSVKPAGPLFLMKRPL